MSELFDSVITQSEGYYFEFMAYLAGEFCPAQQVQVTFSDSDFMRVTIQVAPHVMLSDFGEDDKVPFVIAYLDKYAYDSPTWCILVDGHITGISEINQAGARHLVLQGVSDFITLEDFKLHFFDLLRGGGEGFNSYVTDMTIQSYKLGGQKVDTVGQLPSVLLKKGLLGDTDVTAPFGLLKSCLKFIEINGTESLETRDVSAAALFAHAFAQRTRLYHRFFGLEYDKGEKLISAIYKRLTTFADFGAQGLFSAIAMPIMDRILTEGSMYQWIKSIYDMFMYELVTIPAPSLVDSWDPELRYASPSISQESVLMQIMTKPTTINVVPPLCNMITKAAWSSYSNTTNYREQITRLYLSDGYANNVNKQTGMGFSSAIYQQTLSAYPRQIHEGLIKKNKDKQELLDTETHKGIVSQSMEIPSWLSRLEAVMVRTNSGTIDSQPEAGAPVGKGSKHPEKASDDEGARAAHGNVKESDEEDFADKHKKVKAFTTDYRFQKYNEYFAQYIFHDMRSRASSGSVEVIFNPYVVPSFPILLFAEDALGIHIYARLIGGTHTLGPSPSTTLNLANKRTLGEIIKKGELGSLTADAEVSNTDYNPQEAFTDVANSLQNHADAESRYKEWFYPGVSKNTAVCNYNKFIDKATYLKALNGEAVSGSGTDWNAPEDVRKIIEEPGAFMKEVARPVVKVEDYMLFMGSTISTSVTEGKSDSRLFRAGAFTYPTLYDYEGSNNWGELVKNYKKVIGFSNKDPDLVKVS